MPSLLSIVSTQYIPQRYFWEAHLDVTEVRGTGFHPGAGEEDTFERLLDDRNTRFIYIFTGVKNTRRRDALLQETGLAVTKATERALSAHATRFSYPRSVHAPLLKHELSVPATLMRVPCSTPRHLLRFCWTRTTFGWYANERLLQTWSLHCQS